MFGKNKQEGHPFQKMWKSVLNVEKFEALRKLKVTMTVELKKQEVNDVVNIIFLNLPRSFTTTTYHCGFCYCICTVTYVFVVTVSVTTVVITVSAC